jgi:hypothetical protein
MDASMIVGLVGLAGSGKGTVADYFVSKYGFDKHSFASPIKDITSTLFGWDRALLEGDTEKSRNFREKKQGKYSPREVLQKIGTECFRDTFNSNFWVDSLESRLDISKNIVIADVRFKNEMDWILKNKGRLLWVTRENEPEWFMNLIDEDNPVKPKKKEVHPSEWEWTQHDWFLKRHWDFDYDTRKFKFGYRIDNTSDLKALYKAVKELIEYFWEEEKLLPLGHNRTNKKRLKKSERNRQYY